MKFYNGVSTGVKRNQKKEKGSYPSPRGIWKTFVKGDFHTILKKI